MKIYTRTGDKGETGFIGGRVSKASAMIQLLGELDELNAVMGTAVSSLQELEITASDLPKVIDICLEIQSFLFELGAIVADKALTRPQAQSFAEVGSKQVQQLETAIDTLQQQLPELQNFILPGGSLPSSQLHLARAICRRAERSAVTYLAECADTYAANIQAVQIYLNRLSDLLFVLARSANYVLEVPDQAWKSA